jgi:quercetin dioxygenase-like cupin family protein
MAFIDTDKLAIVERKPGWRGRYFHSPSMTFAHYEFDAGASIHAHSHIQEEVWHVLEANWTSRSEAKRAAPGFVAIVPSDTPHTVMAVSNGRATVVDYPLREM